MEEARASSKLRWSRETGDNGAGARPAGGEAEEGGAEGEASGCWNRDGRAGAVEGKQCADGLFRKRLWGGTFGEVYKRPLCWVEHMSLDNETGLDPSGIRVRPVSGLVGFAAFAKAESRVSTGIPIPSW
ncbi:hypothetical protein LWI29_028183 [Acer saccharum]|uniref:Uncharacterized protein n=1 Tax=Acer saccharum TaxID=4024 RepID=A0AA39SGV0_ACESA|nr:hypothetical protein LWI29_028183 [Acer saccharum]